MIKIVWTNIVLVCSSLIAVGNGLSVRPHSLLGPCLTAAGVMGLSASIGVGFLASCDSNLDPFRAPTRGTTWGAVACVLALITCVENYVATVFGLLVTCLLFAPVYVCSLGVWPIVHWRADRPERELRAAERRRLEIEALERAVGVRQADERVLTGVNEGKG